MTTITALAAAAMITASSTLYPATMTITNITGDIVTMETSTGHTYEMDGAEDYMVGDLVSLIMNDNGTESITDDAIVSARYAGYWTENGTLFAYEE